MRNLVQSKQGNLLLCLLGIIIFSTEIGANNTANTNVVLKAMKDELVRSMEVLGKNASPPPYFISYQITENQSTAEWSRILKYRAFCIAQYFFYACAISTRGSSLVVHRVLVLSVRIIVVLLLNNNIYRSSSNYPGILKLTIKRGRSSLRIVFTFVAVKKKAIIVKLRQDSSISFDHVDCRSYWGLSGRMQGQANIINIFYRKTNTGKRLRRLAATSIRHFGKLGVSDIKLLEYIFQLGIQRTGLHLAYN